MYANDENSVVSISRVDHIPLIWVTLDITRPDAPLVIWLHPGTGKKEHALPAAAGISGFRSGEL